MQTVLVRQFEVAASFERCWEHLAQVERWPSWARHIRSIQLTPPGELGPETEGVIRLRNGIRSRFRMTALNRDRNWVWEGDFLWMRIRYDHVFETLAADRTRILFELQAEGLGRNSLGRLFARLYARSLDRAIPNLIGELEAFEPPNREAGDSK